MWTYALHDTLQIKHTCLEQADITLLNRTSQYTARISKENPATSTITTLGTVDLPEDVTDVSDPRIPGSKHSAVYFIACQIMQICLIFFKFFYHSPH
jgi:hypothetical protein